MDGRAVAVNMGELAISRESGDVLASLGLGSCVALCAYDPAERLAGMIHVVLPDSAIARGKEAVAKFADIGVPRFLGEMEKEGALRRRLKLLMAGGANVLSHARTDVVLDIGTRNIAAVRTAVEKEGLRIMGADVGGKSSRTVRLQVADGVVSVKTLKGGKAVWSVLEAGDG
jgi:chemotaxis protein CheD